MKKLVLILVVAILMLSMVATACSSGADATGTKTVTDLIGRNVEVPKEVDKVAALVGPSYDKVFMLGEQNKLGMIGFAQSPWAQVLNPDLANIVTPGNAQDPNVEELLAQQIDVVFTWDTAEPLQKMSDSGIAALAALASSTHPTSAEEYIAAIKKEVNLYADVLGKDAQKRAEKYCKYLDDIVERVTSVTSKLTDDEKPDVYYIRGPKILSTHGKYSNTRWYVEMAGGNMVSKDLEQLISEVNIEQILLWDPDIIMMGRLDSTEPVLSDPTWASTTAVKNGDVYVNPYGVFYWDYGTEGALFILSLAKTFHPDLFTDIDMLKEIKYYYSEFYWYQLTDEQANKILNNQKP